MYAQKMPTIQVYPSSQPSQFSGKNWVRMIKAEQIITRGCVFGAAVERRGDES